MAIEWTLVESSNVASIGYDEEEKELHVRFNSGSEYVYHDVSADVVQEFLDADSKGKFFARNIKDIYQTEKVG